MFGCFEKHVCLGHLYTAKIGIINVITRQTLIKMD